MRILVFQHLAIEHPGIFRDFLREDGIDWDVVELDEGEAIPPLDGYDALWVMGGPMDVWEEAEHPWLVAEKRAIAEAVLERDMPYFGLCLGHQLLGEACGGRVGPMAQAEVGMTEVELTPAAAEDPVFRELASPQPCLQWHGAAVLEAPPGAAVLASSPLCAVQAMRVGSRAWSVQYHMEISDRTVAEWGDVPAYAAALERTLGAGALARLDAEARAALPTLQADARQLYRGLARAMRR